jgi:solute carrier family 25 carnitine/acylcarnitine transporter 20/29
MIDLVNLLPGLLQGVTRVGISYPADVVKVQMQKNLHPTTMQAVKQIAKTDIRKFYRGSSIAFITIGIERSLQYYYLEKMNKQMVNPYASSFVASLVSSVYNLPMQYLTTNIALLDKTKENVSVNQYVKNTSFKQLYKGYFVETPKNILGSTIYLGTYLKLRNTTDNKSLYPWFGGFSGMLTWLVIYPLDTIKTDYQTTKNKRMYELIRERCANSVTSFYKGITPVLMRTFPSAFAGMYVYEKTRNYLQ